MENENHVSRHPLRGNLFENLVVIEALKYRFNRGKRSNLSFYRDGKGNEVDLILEIGPDAFPIEIKAGATITADYFKGLKNFEKVITRSEKEKDADGRSGLIYGGPEKQIREDTMVYPFYAVDEMLDRKSA